MPRANAGAGEGALQEKGHGGLGALGRACDQDAADGISGEQRQGDARLHLAGQGHGAVRARGVRGLLGRRQGHLAGCGADRNLQEGRRRPRQILRRHRRAGDQGPAQGQYRRGDGARRLRLADDLYRQDRHVFRQRPHAADPRGAAAPESAAPPDAEGGRLPRTRSAREPASGNICRRAAGAGAGACRHPCRRHQFSRYPDGGRRISAQAASCRSRRAWKPPAK